MTKLDFDKIEPQLIGALEKAILKAAEACPEGLYAFLGMEYNKPPENPCDEEFMKTISGV